MVADLRTAADLIPHPTRSGFIQVQQNIPIPPAPPVSTLPVARRPFNKDQIEVHDLGRMDLICRFCKAYHWKAEQLSKKTNGQPNYGMCCFSGKVITPKLENIPPELQQLLDGNDSVSKKFRENIRNYNNALAMTSVG